MRRARQVSLATYSRRRTRRTLLSSTRMTRRRALQMDKLNLVDLAMVMSWKAISKALFKWSLPASPMVSLTTWLQSIQVTSHRKSLQAMAHRQLAPTIAQITIMSTQYFLIRLKAVTTSQLIMFWREIRTDMTQVKTSRNPTAELVSWAKEIWKICETCEISMIRASIGLELILLQETRMWSTVDLC